MEQRSFQAVVKTLDDAGVRYLVVGGLAVVAHGYVRFTADVDLVLEPDPVALVRAIAALEGLGYRPRAPVAFPAFADPIQRAAWARDKGITVFSTFSPAHAATEVDLFLESPFDFEAAHSRAAWMEVSPGVSASFIGRDDLIAMKRLAGRPQDLQDVEALSSIHNG